MPRIVAILAFGTLLSACDNGLFQGDCSEEGEEGATAEGYIDGKWEIDFIDADDCQVDIDIEQDGEDLEGEADVYCVLYYDYYGELWTYVMEYDGADVEGEVDGEDFEIEIEFYDEVIGETVDLVLFGEFDDDEMEGDALLFGSDLGEFEGDR